MYEMFEFGRVNISCLTGRRDQWFLYSSLVSWSSFVPYVYSGLREWSLVNLDFFLSQTMVMVSH